MYEIINNHHTITCDVGMCARSLSQPTDEFTYQQFVKQARKHAWTEYNHIWRCANCKNLCTACGKPNTIKALCQECQNHFGNPKPTTPINREVCKKCPRFIPSEEIKEMMGESKETQKLLETNPVACRYSDMPLIEILLRNQIPPNCEYVLEHIVTNDKIVTETKGDTQ